MLATSTGSCIACRSISDAGGPREVLWANKAAQCKLGRARSREEVLQWWTHVPEKIKPVSAQVLKFLHQHLQVPSSFPCDV